MIRVARGTVALAAVAGILALLQWTHGDGGVFVYFTAQSNTMLAVVFLASAVVPHRVPPVLRGAVTLYLVITGLVYHLLLANPASPFHVSNAGHGRLHDVLLHTVTPLLAVADWLFLTARETRFRWWYAVVWLAYPLIYLGFALVRGAVIGKYPYPFVDAGEHGYGGVAINAVVLTVVFLLLGLTLLGTGVLAQLRVRAGTIPADHAEPGRSE